MKVLVAARDGLANDLVKSLATVRIEVELISDVATALTRLEGATEIVLLDYEMPGLSGTRGIQRVRSLVGDTALGVLATRRAEQLAKSAFVAGATGVLPADADPETLSAALILLGRGQQFVIYRETMAAVTLGAATSLTDRELQVLRGVCDGMQNKEIAHLFGIREVTVKMHMRAIIKKLGAGNRTHAAMIARDLDIV